MNFILLKPVGNQVQVILHNRVHANMTTTKYYKHKTFFFKQALESYHRLASRYDYIVLEGAGSVSKVNLKDRDIVNLPFAKAVGAPTVLITDIDRGSVFASVSGSFALLNNNERDILHSFIINRFRGDLRMFSN